MEPDGQLGRTTHGSRYLDASCRRLGATLAVPARNGPTWLDLGSGGGFPGLVIAILAAGTFPAMAVSLVESDRRKAAFLSSVGRELGLAVRVLTERAEMPCA
jgi:16S rRNA G527 N7-methylase RsmG